MVIDLETRQGDKGQDMKEKMLEILELGYWAAKDYEIIEEFIQEFLNKYQPERLNPEDHVKKIKTFDDYILDCKCWEGPGGFSRYVDCKINHKEL